MEQGVPGSQDQPFYELLHPQAARGSPPAPATSSPPPSSSADEAPEETPPRDHPSPVHDIPPSYDFQLTHSSKSSDPVTSDDVGAKGDDPPPFLYRGSSLASFGDNYGHSGDYHDHGSQGSANDRARVPDQCEPPEVVDRCNQLTVAAIDQTIKSRMDNLLHVIENVSERVSQLEKTVHGLESTIAGLKSADGEKQDRSHEQLSKLEWLVAEVHTGIRLLHDKQVVDDTKSRFSKLQVDDPHPAMDGVPKTSSDGWQQPPRSPKEGAPHVSYSEPPQHLPQHQPPPQYSPPTQSHFPHGPPPPPPDMQQITPPQNALLHSMNTPALQPSYPTHHLPAQPGAPQGPPAAHPPQLSMQVVPFHPQPPQPQSVPQTSYHLPVEAAAYGHMQPQQYNTAPSPPPPPPPSSAYEQPQYTGGPRQQPLRHQEMHPLPQQNSIGSQHMYDGRMGPQPSNMAPSYPQSPQPKPAHGVPMYESSSGSGYGNPPFRVAQSVPPAPGGGGGGAYPRLPTAQPLQHGAVPAAARASSGPSGRLSPIDEVIEKVALMGFPREQVRGVVRQLTESRQSVDMNVVLDKLMNGGDSPQPARGWFGRG